MECGHICEGTLNNHHYMQEKSATLLLLELVKEKQPYMDIYVNSFSKNNQYNFRRVYSVNIHDLL